MEMMEKANKSELLYGRLCRRIAGMANGSPFPTIRQLMAEYEVSQSTVTPAVALLKERGLLEAVPRQGLFVRRESHRPELLLLQPGWAGSTSMVLIRRKLEDAAAKHGFRFRVETFDCNEDICEHLNEYAADVIILDSITNDQLTPVQILRLMQSAAPVILCSNAVPVSQIRYVCGDNAASGVLAARYLSSCGHRKLGLLYCEPHVHTPETLMRSFQFTAESSGCEVTVLDCGMRPGDRPEAKIREFADRYAAGEYDFTALFAVSDSGAVIARREFLAQGIRIPEDLSILGFGNVIEAGEEDLTTIDTPRDQIAEAVLEMASNLLSRRDGFKTQIDIMPELVERSTVENTAVLHRS